MASSFDTTLSSLGISRTGATSSSSSSSTSTSNSTGTMNLDMSDFLQLMTAQMQNQDPFNPVDNTQMVAQMAQLSSVSGISDMNTTLKSISDRLGTTTTTDAMSWIGRTVLTPGDTAYPRTDGSLGGTVSLASDAADVTVTVSNANGQTLKTMDLGAQSAGTTDFEWDGTTDSGDAAGSGPFTIKVGARNADGGSVSATPMVWAPVTSVTMGSDGTPTLTLPGLGQVSASNVVAIG